MQECADKCLNDTHCKSFNYGEGELHFYSDTCELFSDSASSGDGNEGWSCYSKYCCKVDDDTAYHVHAENNSYGLQERSILFLPIAFIIFLLDFWTQRHYVPFKFEGPFVCNISWLNCSRQLDDAEIITNELWYYWLNIECLFLVSGLFIWDFVDIMNIYSQCPSEMEEPEKTECILREFPTGQD